MTNAIVAALNKTGGKLLATDFYPFGTQDLGPRFGLGDGIEFGLMMRAAARAVVDLEAAREEEYFRQRAIVAHPSIFADIQRQWWEQRP